MKMQMILLDATGTIWERVGDQLFSILILFVVAWLLWKRQREMEDRLNKYLEQDREKMLEVISNNTKVMERLEDLLDKK